jgi:hypothetical protein
MPILRAALADDGVILGPTLPFALISRPVERAKLTSVQCVVKPRLDE